MIVKKEFLIGSPNKIAKAVNKNMLYILDGLNEIDRKDIIQINTVSNAYGLISYIVFYEDKGICTCPGCGHDISNTFSFCPNCGYKMSSEADEPLQCPTCNNNVAYTFDYCPHCATKLK